MAMQWLVRLSLPLLAGVFVFVGIAVPNLDKRFVRENPVTVLLYNHITESLPPDARFGERYYFVLQKDFDKELSILEKRGFTFISYDTYKKIQANQIEKPKLPLVITFRDANADIETYGLPILKKHNVPATVFYQPTSHGKPKFLTDEQIRTLEANNVAVVDADFALLNGTTMRNEVSGVIRTAQFEDLLPHKLYNSWFWAVALGVLTLMIAAFTLLFPRASLVLPILFLPTYVVRFTVFGIPATLLELVTVIVVGATLITQWKSFKALLFDFPYLLQTSLFLFAALFSTAFAQDKMAALGGLKAYVLEPIAFALCVFYWVRRDASEQKAAIAKPILQAYVLISSVVAVLALKNYLLDNAYINFNLEKLTTYFGNPNYLASILAIGILICFYFLFYSEVMSNRVFATAALIPLLPAFYLSKSDTGTLGVGTALGLLLLYRFMKILHVPKWLPFAYTVASIFAISTLFLLITSYQAVPILNRIGAATVLSRSFIYQATIKIIREKPITGVGLLNYNREFITHVDPLSPEQNVALAHNTLLDFTAQMGIFGVLAYLWLVIRFFRITLIAANQKHRENAHLAIVLSVVLLAIFFHGMLDSQYHKNDYSLIFWTLLGLSTQLTIFSPQDKRQ